MTVSLENVTRTVDGIPTIRDVSLTLTRGTLSVLKTSIPYVSQVINRQPALGGRDAQTHRATGADGGGQRRTYTYSPPQRFTNRTSTSS